MTLSDGNERFLGQLLSNVAYNFTIICNIQVLHTYGAFTGNWRVLASLARLLVFNETACHLLLLVRLAEHWPLRARTALALLSFPHACRTHFTLP